MNAYKKYKNRLERFLQSERGKRFINFAYSFGAAIVILGAMFKLLHFPFGNEMLFIGMVTECIVFALSAFDTPIRDYRWEQVFPALSGNNGSGLGNNAMHAQQVSPTTHEGELPVAESILRGGAGQVAQEGAGTIAHEGGEPFVHGGDPFISGISNGDRHYISGVASHGSPGSNPITAPSTSQLSSYTEEFGRQMENLNRTLSGLNSIYEIQLKSVSSQIGTIEQINQGLARFRTMYGDALPDGSVIKTETEKMAHQLRELNEVYARMLHAMTVNRYENPNNTNP